MSGTEFRAAEVHTDPAILASLLFGAVYIVDHHLPLLRAIVSTIDPVGIDVRLEESVNQIIIVSGVARQGYHDSRDPVADFRTQQGRGIDLLKI